MIEVTGVNKMFGEIKALDNIVATIQEGSIFGLIGTNGAGKSTLLRVISGVLKPDTGMALIDGENVYENPQAKAKIFFLPDNAYFFQNATAKTMAEYYQVIYPQFDMERFREMEKSGADILKIAVMPHGFGDVAAIMEATNDMRKECEKPLVSMAMGSIGSISRIAGENFGSSITFGTVGAASAPGQFPIGDLRTLLAALHQKNQEA